MNTNRTPAYILPLIILSQLAGTSLWFAGNAVIADLQQEFHLPPGILGHVTIAVQTGFIIGTLVFAVTMIADRMSPSLLFFLSSLMAAVSNLVMLWNNGNEWILLMSRAATGFFLAGVYPVGMKIAADWYEKGLGKALGFLVGALVLGTAFPHALRGYGADVQWRSVVIITSIIACTGGILVWWFIKDGPYKRPSSPFDPKAIKNIFREKKMRIAAYAYWGHMWEVYAYWAFVPFMISYYATEHQRSLNVSMLSFAVIGIGSIGCAVAGILSKRFGSAWVGNAALTGSLICCIISPLAYAVSFPFFMVLMLVWGVMVCSDSAQFTSLVALNVNADHKGTALTFVTCVGFAITIISIQLSGWFWNNDIIEPRYIMLILAAGPLFGVIRMATALRTYP